ncbi:glycogen/starch synthase [Shewanella sp. 1CM18E]|uniref:glycogen synthase n=1 Tax=Shewanella sp. 1CM18E TaxID=2929169 RepID=UPI0020BEF92C|nr:glycogen/starch synthase [Shewanella sp. 1CM18E]MCK8043544.1 glycogen/starch synthase [Shewanella sp. 1CM18E]
MSILDNQYNRPQPRVLMLAAENGAIPGAKVGGMADVLHDLPLALAKLNIAVDVIMPSFGSLIASANAHWEANIDVDFQGQHQRVAVYRAANPKLENSHFYLLEHGLFNGSLGAYSQGDAQRPFAEDATKFALFNLAVAEALSQDFYTDKPRQVFNELPSHIHLHDWHTGMFAALRAFDRRYRFLQDLPCVFSIHNLALQGIRPLNGDSSSLAAWYPRLTAELSPEQLCLLQDPRYYNCVNPMRAGIVLSDKVHLVSPSYAHEVLRPSAPEQGFFGGEGLEHDLQAKLDKQALVGILNGCMYPDKTQVTDSLADSDDSKLDFVKAALDKLINWQVGKLQVRTQDFIAQARLQQWQSDSLSSVNKAKDVKGSKAQHAFLLTSVGRLTDQKVMILRHRFSLEVSDNNLRGKTVLEVLLAKLAEHDSHARFVMLGSGDNAIAREFADIAARHKQFIFMDGYDEQLSEQLYELGSLFLMPSSFEPCGISQMLAMRAGQLCLVNHIGGLKDTVHHLETGFVFEGEDIQQQGLSLLATFDKALSMSGSATWQQMQQCAKSVRFDWLSQAKRYKSALYDLA